MEMGRHASAQQNEAVRTGAPPPHAQKRKFNQLITKVESP